MSNHIQTSLTTIIRGLRALQNSGQPTKTPRGPSQRSRQIYHRVVILCERQCEVAQDLGITPSRVSQVVRRVRHWLATTPSASSGSTLNLEPGALNSAEQQRLDRAVNRDRHLAIYELLMREAHRQSTHPHHTTIHTESKPSADVPPDSPALPTPHSEFCIPHSACIPSQIPNPKSEIIKTATTVRDQPLNVQLLKAAQRSALELERLAAAAPLPDPEPEWKAPDDDSLFFAIGHLLTDLRLRAEQQGRVPKSQNVDQLVENFLSSLLGKDQRSAAGFFHLDDAIRQLVRRFLIKPIPFYPPNPEPEQLLADVLPDADDGSSSTNSRSHAPRGNAAPDAPRLSIPHSELRAPHSSSPPTRQHLTPSSSLAPSSPAPTSSPPTSTQSCTSVEALPKSSPPKSLSTPSKKSKNLTPSPPRAHVIELIDPEVLARFCHPWSRDY